MSKNAKSKNLNEQKATASLKALRITPSKLMLVANLIRNMHVNTALVQLEFSKKRISQDVRKCLQSAIANAENNHNMNIDDLYIANVDIGKAFVMKRFRAGARGRGMQIKKFFSKLSITLKEREE